MDYTYNISQYERNSGSIDELKAFKYIESTLRSFGIKTSLKFHDAFISLPLKSELLIDGVSFPCITTSMSGATGEDGVSLNLLYIEDNMLLDDPLFDCTGKALIIHGFAERGIVQKAMIKGAKGCIFINGEYVHNMIVSPVWGNPTRKTIHEIPRLYILNVAQNAGMKIIEAAKEQKQAHITTRLDEGWRKIPSLIADIEGEEDSDQYILFSGHVDSWHYGAMDNGTANAVMIEVARIISQYPLRRSLKVAFWSGHSHGRYAGSAHYYDQNFHEIYDNCLLHVNVDSVGAKGATIVTEGNIMALTKKIAAEVIKEETGQTFKGKPFGRSGDQSFWGAGVPSAFMGFSGQPMKNPPEKLDTYYMIKQFNNGPDSSGFGWWWHTTEDTFDKIDESILERDAKVYLSFVYRCCHDKLIPLDIHSGVEELKGFIENYMKLAQDSVNTEKLKHYFNEFYQLTDKVITKIKQSKEDDIQKNNELIKSISRVVVRLMQVNISEFEPDPALPLPPVPLLASIHELKDYNRNDKAYFMLVTEIQRRVNQVSFILKQGVKDVMYILNE
ncbi:M28 family peptidase [Sporosarcina sp. FSL W8-0480]|uniref:M28 family metallopeptidase n=1 Tax=Sporosarcina sp. FSL W8-0480 TaxID=2954701 RepID=UPI0030D7F653